MQKRIKGFGWSLNDFWEADADQFAYLYRRESELIKEDLKEAEKNELEQNSSSNSGRMIPNKVEDAQENIDAYNSYMVD